jgi:hypothetical protein
MRRYDDKKRAVSLYKQGMNLSEIESMLGVGRAVLLVWLRDTRARRNSPFSSTVRNAQTVMVDTCEPDDSDTKMPENGHLIAGLLLYWTKGSPVSRYSTVLTNTDLAVLQFYPHVER